MKRANLPEKIFLTGFMGAGKTSVGRFLAGIVDAPFCDLDSLLCERKSAEIEDMISSLGEPEFRRLESELLAEVCSLPGTLVVSTGGGAVMSERNRRAMEQSGVVIYLKARLETLMERISKDVGVARPLLKVDDPLARAAELLSAREPFYARAGVIMETDGLSARKVAEKAADIFRSGEFRKKEFDKQGS